MSTLIYPHIKAITHKRKSKVVCYFKSLVYILKIYKLIDVGLFIEVLQTEYSFFAFNGKDQSDQVTLIRGLTCESF